MISLSKNHQSVTNDIMIIRRVRICYDVKLLTYESDLMHFDCYLILTNLRFLEKKNLGYIVMNLVY